jgi:Polysaccharide biosynthesis enzyme WcbI
VNAKVAIIGNCQAQFLEGLFLTGGSKMSVQRLKPVFELQETDKSSILSVLEGADFIFAQRVASDYHLEWVRTEFIKGTFGAKAFTWPNIYFDGYFPDARYIYLGAYGKVQGPLDDYHLQRIVDAHRAKRPADSIAAEISSSGRALDGDAFQVSLNNLIGRERDVDIAISDFIASEVGKRRAFYTPNHPFNFVLIEMARRLANQSGLAFDPRLAEAFNYRLDRIYIPGYRGILQAQQVQFNETYIYRGLRVEDVSESKVTLGDALEYSIEELVVAFYGLYDKVFPKS